MLNIGEIVKERYRIEKVLGEGGMGVVYLGKDIDLERFVAVKEIKSSLPDYDKYIERIKKEAKVLAKLNHSNIVILYDLIKFQNNWHLVMEYVEGMTLDKKLVQVGALPDQEATPIFKQILAALDHAHQAGIIHRDVKPGNVMIKSDGRVKVMDFGLAKDQTNLSATRSTKTEHTGGTLYYLSPEQVESDGKVVDHRSDIYSLGMTCYEVLAGFMPLKDKKTTVKILNAILRDNFPPPTKFNATVPKELSKIVLKAIALKPEKRFQSAGEMLAEVEKFETGQKKNEDPVVVKKRRIRLVFEIIWGIISVALVVTLLTIFFVPDLPLRMLKWVGLRSPTRVAVYTEPASAEIKLGGKSAGESPLLSRFVDVDTLEVSIEKTTYFSIDTSIALKGVPDKALSFTLTPAATFAITVVPESAEIMIDGKIIPPAERRNLELTVGEHNLRIASAGYETIDGKIFLRQGLNAPRVDTLKLAMIAASLKPTPKDKKKPPPKPASEDSMVTAPTTTSVIEARPRTGILTFTINPPSEVYIGDSLAATAATQPRFTLPLGNCVLKIVHATLGRWLETIAITEQGASRKIDFTKKFTIRVLAFDSNNERIAAAIYLDNRPADKSTPDQLLLNCGYHQIEVRLEGYDSERKGFNVEKSDKLEFRLERTR